MICPFCGRNFQEDDGIEACPGCPLARSCRMIKCPGCGYEIPVEPRLIKALKAWRRRESGTGGKS